MNPIDEIIEISKSANCDKAKIINIVKNIVLADRKKLLRALSDETMYEYDDIFKKVKIELTQ